MSKTALRITTAVYLVTVAMSSPIATAQTVEPTGQETASPETVDTGDIVVTATRRSQSLQEVPMSISAVTATALQSKVATTFIDYASSVPNLSFSVSGVGPSSGRSVAVRGIADVNTTGFYIDESPLVESLDPRILDVDRVEVLRGPQGTLFGARSLGGTVRLITTQPSASETSGRAHASISTTKGTNKPNYQIDGAINLPIVTDKVGLRVVGLRQYDAGYYTRTFDRPAGGTQTLRNIGRTITDGVSASAVIKLTDELSVTPRILFQHTRLNGLPLADVAVDKSSPVPSVLRVKSLDQRRTFDVAEASEDKWLLGTVDVKLEKSFGTFSYSTTLFRRRTRDVEDQTDFIASAFGLSQKIPTTIEVNHPTDSFAQELRFSSTFKGPFQVVAGLFYDNIRSNEWSPPNIIPGIDAALGGVLGTDFIYQKNWPSKQEDFAAYGEVNWNVLPRVTLITGARLFKTKTTASIQGDGIVYGGPSSRPSSTLNESGVTPKASIQYEFSRGNQIYVTAAKGFRPGGPNQLFPTLFGCDTDLAALGLTSDQAAFYKSDSVWSYEVGAKATMFDRKLRASISGFRIDWGNIQQKILLQCGFDFKRNSGAARSQGFEFELNANPVDGLTLSAGGGYVDAKIVEQSPTSRFKVGDRIPQVPKWNLNFSADYRQAISGNMEGFLHADYTYVDSSNSSLNANVDPVSGRLIPRIRPSYELVNTRLGVSFGEQTEIALFAKNLTDERASLSDITSAAVEAPDRARVAINQPRTFGIEARYKF